MTKYKIDTEEPNGNGERKDARIQRAGRKVIWAAAACLMINVVIFGWLISKTLVQRAAGEAKSESAIVSYDRTESMKSQLESHAEGFEGIADASSAQPATKELDEAGDNADVGSSDGWANNWLCVKMFSAEKSKKNMNTNGENLKNFAPAAQGENPLV